jgi:hypothetical protein
MSLRLLLLYQRWIRSIEINLQNANNHIHHLESQHYSDKKILVRLYKFIEEQEEFIRGLNSVSSIKPL